MKTDIATYSRSKRGLNDNEKQRGKAAGTLLKKQLAANGVSLDDLAETMNLRAQHTLKRHILSGSITLAEMLILNDYYPVDITGILRVMRDERTPRSATPEAVFVREEEEWEDTGPLNDEAEAFARLVGIDLQHKENDDDSNNGD